MKRRDTCVPGSDSPSFRSWAPTPNTSIRASHSSRRLGTAGNLVTDAQIAAITLEHNAVVHTSDTDFVRFAGVRWSNPISGTGSRSLKKKR